MNTKILFFKTNLIDSLLNNQIIPSTEVVSVPAINLKDQQKSKVWRTTSVADQNVTFDFGAPVSISEFLMTSHNLTSGAVITILGNTSNSWGSPTFSQTVTWHRLMMIKRFAVQNLQWWRIRIQDAGNTAGFLEVGRMFLGSYYSPALNYSWDWQRILNDPSTKTRSLGGQESVNLKQHFRTYSINLSHENLTDMDAIESMFDEIGIGKDIFIAFDYDKYPNKETVYGKLTDPMKVNHFTPRYAQFPSINFQESL